MTGELDGGPIVRQSRDPGARRRHPETLAARILDEEHRIYPEAVALVLDGGWTIDGRRFRRTLRSARGWRYTTRTGGAFDHERRIGSSVSTATSGGQLMRTGT